ncbi:MAG: bifunctional 4-hydroxy-2-oxoglutarate aldolase/2-dehydro-3-deoxy-phosphogluconate aldolase [Defluviitaleaceae bacterium]|nr:bifunctional 4-hydroxy-2-oxoglutarate aldolase/2-dehydro-3-deoxy-phosphogluconate aldolase [Defluviitaleaceae bacterium]
MKRLTILKKLLDCGVIAVVRGDNPQEVLESCYACVKGGLYGLEVTFTINGASDIISDLAEKYKEDENVVIGAGTVLDPITARIAILSGAEFVVSPSFDKETAKICNLYQIPYLPGCMTITEMATALEYGVDIIKLFPGSAFGPSFIKSVKAPLPQANIMPTGGVSIDNMEQWFKNGAVAVGVGGNLFAPAKTGDFEKVAQNAKEYVDRFKATCKNL